jgi:PA14 domain
MVLLTGAFFGATSQAATQPVPSAPLNPRDQRAPDNRPRGREGRFVLDGLTTEIVPATSNIWQCACDTDGCYPGCFTIASATILEFWAKRGYPALWDGETNATLERLRDLFPNLFCYDNKDNDGQPGESGYDAFDVAKGFDIFVRERGYKFRITPVPSPTFEQIVAEIDAGRPVIGAFGTSPWGSHAGTIIGYDTTDGRQIMIVRPNLTGKLDTELTWGKGYGSFGLVTIEPTNEVSDLIVGATRYIEILVDDTDSGFVMNGDWRMTEGLGVNNGARAVLSTDPSNLGPAEDTATATWTPALPYDGMYEVQAFMPREDGNDSITHLATYHVLHAEGESFVRRSHHDARAGWMPLGAFPFVKGQKSMVRVGNKTGDQPPRTLWADAVRFVWKGPIVVQREEGGPVALIVEGKLREVRDAETLNVLKLRRSSVRPIALIEYAQYQAGEALPSMFSSWVGQYFDNTGLTPPFSAVRSDDGLNFVWSGAAPVAGLNDGNFSARWTRTLALTEGDYPFIIEAAGGLRLWVDGKLEIDAWDAPSTVLQRHEKVIGVLSGLHRVDIEYTNRGGNGELRLANLPPNAPVVIDNTGPRASSPEITLRWLDGGDPDNVNVTKPRRFFASLWNDAGFRATTGWVTDTVWSYTLPEDGRYQWSVVATDGVANSASSPARTILLDSTAPWSQMTDAKVPVGRVDFAQAAQNSELRLVTDANGNQIVVDSGEAADQPQLSRGLTVLNRPLYQRFGNAPVVQLTWWATDSLSMPDMRYALQARELVRARTEYTLTTTLREVTRLAYELVLSGTQEITQPVVLTETVAFSDVTPVLAMTQVTNTEWITVHASLATTSTVFAGYPGSTYEFRVRAIDGAGNEQQWYDGYSLQVKLDESTALPKDMKPLTLFDVDRTLLTDQALTAPEVLTPTAALTGTWPMTSPFAVPITLTESLDLTTTTALTSSTPVTSGLITSGTDELSVMPTVVSSGTLAGTPTSADGLLLMPTIPVDGAPGGVPLALGTPAPPVPGGLEVMPTLSWSPAPPTPTATSIPIVTSTPVPTATPLPSPTSTLEPTATAEPTLTPTVTETITAIAAP